MNSTSFARMFSGSLILATLTLPLASQAAANHHTARLHGGKLRATTSKRKLMAHSVAKTSVSLSPLDRMALAHAARRAAIARSMKGRHFDAREDKDAEEEREGKEKNLLGMTGGDYFMWQLRAWPDGFIDPTAAGRAIAQRSRMRAGYIGYAGSSKSGIGIQSLFPSATWSFVGPINWYPTTQRTYYGPESMNGHVRSIVADPTNHNIIYAASETGGVFKTTNGGVVWKPLSNNWLYLNTNTLAMDPRNHLTLYAGTGSSPTGFGSAIGLMKTTDGGLTWSNIGADKDASGNPLYFAGANVTGVLVDPANSNSVTVLTSANASGPDIWNSTNAGVTWNKKVSATTSGVSNSAPDSDVSWQNGIVTKNGVYLAAGYSPATNANFPLYGSTDQGQTWAQLPNAPIAPATAPRATGVRLAASSVDANTIYLIYAYKDYVTLFKTSDSGASWTDITAATGLNSGFLTASQLDQVFHDFYLGCSQRIVSGVAKDVLYLGLKNVYQQVQNVGSTPWVNFGEADGANSNTHSDQQCVAFDPTNPDRGWLGNDGGIYQFYSNPTTGAHTFLSLNDTMQTTQFYNTAYHPTDPHIMIGGTQDNGTAGAFGDLNSWQMPTAGDGFYTAINPVNPQNMYASYTNGAIYRTDDMFQAGRTTITPDLTGNGTGPIAFVTPFVLDPSNPNYLYTAGQKLGRYDATKPLATAWTYFPTVLTTDKASTLAVSAADGARIYVASATGGLYTTGDGGTTWVTLKAGGGAATDTLPNKNIGSVLPDPANAKAVFVGLSGVNTPSHFYYCPDVTAVTPTWTNLSGLNATALPDAPLNTIAIDPADANTLYVGTDVGVFQTADRGQTWSNATAPLGLPNIKVTDLKAMPLQGYLYAGTYGRGIYRIRIRNNDPVSGLLFTPEKVNGGQIIAGTVLLGAAAPAGGTTVTLTSSVPATAQVPATITVPQGQSQAGFTVTTSPVGFTTPVNITASVGAGVGESKSGSITVLSGTILPVLQSLAYVDYGSGLGFPITGTTSLQARVTLSKASAGDITVTLTSSNPNSASVPASVVVPAGQTTAQFTVDLKPIASPETTTISAQLGSFKKNITATRN